MEFLWQKEDASGLYLDLYANIQVDYPDEYTMYDLNNMSIDLVESTLKKNNKFSDQRRAEGNVKLREKKLSEAMKFYNDCLCLAQNGTESVAFAYGNRSACHLQMKMYPECIADIDLALKELCTEELKERLITRKNDCEELLHTLPPAANVNDSKKLEIKLSYDADPNFPFMAKILEVRKNDEFGRFISAKCDIPVGRTVLLENNFISHTPQLNHYTTEHFAPLRCVTCNKIPSNPLPCQTCTMVMFCNAECRDRNEIHQMDCGAVYYMSGSNHKFIIQSVVRAVKLFPTVDELKNFVEDVVTNAEKFETPKSILDEHSQYRMFLTLWVPSKVKDFIPQTYKLYQTILRLNEIKRLFDTETKQRFLMHLVAYHAVILLYNATEGQLCVFSALFSHSCVPNLQEIWTGSRTMYITIRPVKRGDQLCIAYMTEAGMRAQGKDHKEEIYSKFGFRCKCVKCEGKLTDSKRVEKDAGFQQIHKTDIDNADENGLQKIIGKCTALLNKYENMPWSRQLDYVSRKLGYCLGKSYYSLGD